MRQIAFAPNLIAELRVFLFQFLDDRWDLATRFVPSELRLPPQLRRCLAWYPSKCAIRARGGRIGHAIAFDLLLPASVADLTIWRHRPR